MKNRYLDTEEPSPCVVPCVAPELFLLCRTPRTRKDCFLVSELVLFETFFIIRTTVVIAIAAITEKIANMNKAILRLYVEVFNRLLFTVSLSGLSLRLLEYACKACLSLPLFSRATPYYYKSDNPLYLIL